MIPLQSFYSFSTHAATDDSPEDSSDALLTDGPRGSLFETPHKNSGNFLTDPSSLIGQRGYVERTFSPQSNAQAMITCGGPALAAHASFDPNYERAASWIKHHAVGPAVLSPVLVSGLVGALTEAAFPHGIVLQHTLTMSQTPLIVGVSVMAQIHVTHVARQDRHEFLLQKNAESMAQKATTNDSHENDAAPTSHYAQSSSSSSSLHEQQPNHYQHHTNGFVVQLDTSVVRVHDEATIARGEQFIWIPDYQNL